MKILSIYLPSIALLQGIDSFSLISRREIPLQPQQQTNLKSEQEDCSTILNLKNQHYNNNNNCSITNNLKVTKVHFHIIETSNYLTSTKDWSSSDNDDHDHDCCSSSPSTINLKDNKYDSNHHSPIAATNMKVAKVSFNIITRDEATTNITCTTSLPYITESYHYDDYDDCPKIMNIKKTNGQSNNDNHCAAYNIKVTNVDFNIAHDSINVIKVDAPNNNTSSITDNDQSNRNSNCSVINLKQDNNDNSLSMNTMKVIKTNFKTIVHQYYAS